MENMNSLELRAEATDSKNIGDLINKIWFSWSAPLSKFLISQFQKLLIHSYHQQDTSLSSCKLMNPNNKEGMKSEKSRRCSDWEN